MVRNFRLGTALETALDTVGIDKAFVAEWVGDCNGCAERRQKLNALGAWSARILSGKMERAKEYLTSITAS